jgi:hypothetical protein
MYPCNEYDLKSSGSNTAEFYILLIMIFLHNDIQEAFLIC